MTLTAIIPLRAGSKRIKGKNVKLLNGKPLFTYTLDNALKSKKIDNIIITTDDLKVIEILNNEYKKELDLGILIILKRNKKLSSDKSTTIDVILDVIKKSIDIKNIILLQATSPLRDNIDIDKSIKLFLENKDSNIIGVTKVVESPFWQYKINDKGYLENLFDKKYLSYRSQDLPLTYIPNGSIFILSVKKLKKDLTFYGQRIIPYIMDRNKSIDIDEIEDFEYCEFLLNKLKNEK